MLRHRTELVTIWPVHKLLTTLPVIHHVYEKDMKVTVLFTINMIGIKHHLLKPVPVSLCSNILGIHFILYVRATGVYPRREYNTKSEDAGS